MKSLTCSFAGPSMHGRVSFFFRFFFSSMIDRASLLADEVVVSFSATEICIILLSV